MSEDLSVTFPVLKAWHPGLTHMGQIRIGLWAFLRKKAKDIAKKKDGELHLALDQRVTHALDIFQVSEHDLLEVLKLGGIQSPHREVHPPVSAWIRDAAHDLMLAGVLRISHASGNSTYDLTYYGYQRLLADDEGLSSDPGSVVDAFLAKFGGVDNSALLASYLGQASRCSVQGMALAGATMIGCAYELAVAQLADTLVEKWVPDSPSARIGDLNQRAQENLKQHFKVQAAIANGEKVARFVGAAALLEAVGAALEAIIRFQPSPLHKQRDWICNVFPRPFHYVREMRNDAGHPSGRRIDLDYLRQDVMMFTRDYREVREIIDAIRSYNP